LEEVILEKQELLEMSIEIESSNNFMTASGLASSSSGLSCLAYALSLLYGIKENFPGEISIFARLGSGSASRSLYGGLVKWDKGFQ